MMGAFHTLRVHQLNTRTLRTPAGSGLAGSGSGLLRSRSLTQGLRSAPEGGHFELSCVPRTPHAAPSSTPAVRQPAARKVKVVVGGARETPTLHDDPAEMRMPGRLEELAALLAPGFLRVTVRCAVHTRKSAEGGFEQDFNSLDVQREGAEA